MSDTQLPSITIPSIDINRVANDFMEAVAEYNKQNSAQPLPIKREQVVALMEKMAWDKTGRLGFFAFTAAIDPDGDDMSTQQESQLFIMGEQIPYYSASEEPHAHQLYQEWISSYPLWRSLINFLQTDSYFGDLGITNQDLSPPQTTPSSSRQPEATQLEATPPDFIINDIRFEKVNEK